MTDATLSKLVFQLRKGDSILKLLQRVSRPEIHLWVGFHSELDGIYFSSQEQIAYFLTQEAAYLLVHFKFLRVYRRMGSAGPVFGGL